MLLNFKFKKGEYTLEQQQYYSSINDEIKALELKILIVDKKAFTNQMLKNIKQNLPNGITYGTGDLEEKLEFSIINNIWNHLSKTITIVDSKENLFELWKNGYQVLNIKIETNAFMLIEKNKPYIFKKAYFTNY